MDHHSSRILHIPAAWGRLAAVRRTLEWVSNHPDLGLKTVGLGANCARLVTEAMAADPPAADPRQEDPSPDLHTDLTALVAGLLQLDHLADPSDPDASISGWLQLVQALSAQVDGWVALSQAGARVAIFPLVGRLIVPRRSRRGRDRGRVFRGDPSKVDAASDASPATAKKDQLDGAADAKPSASPAAVAAPPVQAADAGDAAERAAAERAAAERAAAERATAERATAERATPGAADTAQDSTTPAKTSGELSSAVVSSTVGSSTVQSVSDQPRDEPSLEDLLEEAKKARDRARRQEAETEVRVSAVRRSQRGGGRRGKRQSSAEEGALQRLPFTDPQRGGALLSSLDGLDEAVQDALAAAGLSTIADLLTLPPTDYDRRSYERSLADGALVDSSVADASGELMVRGRVESRCSRLSPGLARRELVLGMRDGARVVARWVGAPPRGFSGWNVGQEVALVGLPELVEVEDAAAGASPADAEVGDRPADAVVAIAAAAAPAEATDDQLDLPAPRPQYTLYQAETVGLDGRGSGWLARYGVPGLDDRDLRDAMARALVCLADGVSESLPRQVLENQRLLTLHEALRDAHFPANTSGRGRTRMAFEELFLLQLGVAIRSGRGSAVRGAQQPVLHGYLGQLELQHGVVLDDQQQRALDDILRDLVSPRPMTRLLQGDVGTGKGLVALLSAVAVVEGRGQVAMVCPDALTAERRFLFAEPLLRSLGVSPILTGSSVSHAQADAIKRGEAHLVFGTGALLDPKLSWKRLSMVVVEERDRFGTVSTADLPQQPARPDLLVMTTVPIPASLALSVFGEFDLTIVPRSAPVSLKPQVYTDAQRAEAYQLVREELAAGHQAMVVFPVAEGHDLLGPDDAQRFADAMRLEYLPDTRMAVYASAMGREERFRVFDDFTHRRIDVLVSTTYIEDAPAVDNATVLVVEHADKHSLVRLHRLRSHLRHGRCVMVLGDQPSDAGVRLVELVQQEADGFRLAELDLQVRGVEALLGHRAKEAPDFAWADPPQDRALLLRARAEAFAVARVDPDLRRSSGLARAVQSRWGDWLGEDAVAPAPRPERNSRRRRRRRRRPASS